MAKNIFTALDIGTSRIRAVIGMLDEDKKIRVIGVGIATTNGMRRGAVVDIEDVTNAITTAVEEAERMAGEPFHNTIVGISGINIQSHPSKGIAAVARQGNEIMLDDISRTIDAATKFALPANQQVLRAVPRTFTVDNDTDIKDPIGMTGIRLEVDAIIFTAPTTVIKNIEKCVSNAGIHATDIIPNILASSEMVLTRRQKELGVCVIDIGMSGTSLAIFIEGIIAYTGYFAAGGESVTNDLAIGLRSSIDTAESVKIEYGSSVASEVNKRDTIDLSQFSKIDLQKINKHEMAQIIEARMSEIFQLVRETFRGASLDGLLPAGVILIGGGSKIPYTVDLARNTLNLPIQIGFPQIDSVVDQIDDPSYVNVLGLLTLAQQSQKGTIYSKKFQIPNINGGKLVETAKDWLKHLLP